MKSRICVAFAVTEVEWLIEHSTSLNKRQRAELAAQVRDAKARGFDVVPPCPNINERGLCLGHVIIEDNERP